MQVRGSYPTNLATIMIMREHIGTKHWKQIKQLAVRNALEWVRTAVMGGPLLRHMWGDEGVDERESTA